MGRVGEVNEFARGTFEGAQSPEITVDVGSGSPSTAQHHGSPGEDSPPLPGVDFAHLSESPGAGSQDAVGYVDTVNEGKASPGEVRRIARAADGTPVAELWLKQSGDVEITSLKAGGKLTLNGVEIDQDGNISAPGEVTAKAGPGAVNVSTHLHPTAMGPSGAPTPGT